MKIMQIMLSKDFGGAERLFVDCCKSMASFGHDIVAVCHPNFIKMSSLVGDNISIFPLKVRFDYSPFARLKLSSIVRKCNPEVIHTHLCRASLLGGDVGSRFNVPVAANIHNYVKLKYYKNVSCYIPGTDDQKRYLMNLGVNHAKIQIIPHFSMLKSNVSISSSDINNVIVSYGRFVKKKGFDLLLDAIKLVTDLGYNVRLILGGDGPERKNLENKVKQLGVEKYVVFYGWVEDVEQFLNIGKFFVLPSMDEPFGIVVLEAMAQSNTIISSKTQGPMEILNQETAWMFDVGNVEEMARSIIMAIDHYDQSLYKSMNAHDKFVANYSFESIIPLYLSLFKKMRSQYCN